MSKVLVKTGGYVLVDRNDGYLLWHTFRKVRRECWEAVNAYTPETRSKFNKHYRIVAARIELIDIPEKAIKEKI